MSIRNIILEELILEGRVEDVKSKYPGYEEYIDYLSSVDPSGNNKYLDWMMKMVSDHRAGSTVIDGVTYFHNNLHRFEQKDINQFKKWSDFQEARTKAETVQSRKELKEQGAEKIFENDRYLVIRPKTHQASCKYGSNTKWCITMRDYANYFDSYTNHSSFFFVIDKVRNPSLPGLPRENYYKIAIQWRPRDSRFHYNTKKEDFINSASMPYSTVDFWTVSDRAVTEKTFKKYVGEDTQPILNAIETYMKNLHKSFYEKMSNDSGDDVEKLNRIQELKIEKQQLSARHAVLINEYYTIRDRINEEAKNISYYKQMLTRVKTTINRLGGEELDDEQILRALGVIDKYYEAMSPSDELNERAEGISTEINSIVERIKVINTELSSLERKQETHQLYYRDKNSRS